MKQTLAVRFGQHVSITPQMQQAFKLMQLSTVELQQEVMQTLESNPMLELAEEGDDYDDEADAEEDRQVDDEANEYADGDGREEGQEEGQEEGLEGEEDLATIPDDLAVDVSWDDIYPTGDASAGAPREDGFEEQHRARASLRDDLLWQLHLTTLPNERLRFAALVVIDSIDENGMLTASAKELRSVLDTEPELRLPGVQGLREMEEAVRVVQRFDPPGVGARDLRECLLLQLQRLPDATPWRNEAANVIRKHFPLLASQDMAALARRAKLPATALAEVVALIRSLNPRPGAAVGEASVEYVVPDVIVRKSGCRWSVELNTETMPRVRVNQAYARYIKAGDTSADNLYLKDNLQDAKWFLKNLEYRNETLLKVAANIVERQQGFLERGEVAMKPLVLADVAAAVDRHESTISRVTTRKYMDTPHGVFELKYFFSSHVGTVGGGEMSSTAIRAMIKQLTTEEDPRKPLSDDKIATLLRERGIEVARRTVAKYREGLAIPPSNQRKRLI